MSSLNCRRPSWTAAQIRARINSHFHLLQLPDRQIHIRSQASGVHHSGNAVSLRLARDSPASPSTVDHSNYRAVYRQPYVATALATMNEYDTYGGIALRLNGVGMTSVEPNNHSWRSCQRVCMLAAMASALSGTVCECSSSSSASWAQGRSHWVRRLSGRE